MASFWLDPATNKRYNEGRAFTYNDKQYTRSGASASTFSALGFTAVTVGARPDDRFYIVSGPDNTGAYTSTARDLADLKENYVRQTKLSARNILKKTDWLVIRKEENASTIPASVETFRDAVRTVSDDNCTAINAAATVEALKALIDAPYQVEDVNNPGTMIANPAALDAYPDEVAGYDY